MKTQYISTGGKFIGTHEPNIPNTNLPINKLFYQVIRKLSKEHIGYICLDPDDNRFKFTPACLVTFSGIDLLDIQCLISKIRQAYLREQRSGQ